MKYKILQIIDTFDKKYSSKYLNNLKFEKFIRKISIDPIFIYIFFLLLNIFLFNNIYFKSFVFFTIFWLIIICIKHIVRRPRPILIKGYFLQEILSLKPDNYAFPSAHTFVSFQIIPLAFSMNFLLGIMVCIYSILIAFSRIYLKFHYISDVTFGIIAGILCGFISIL